MFRTVTRNRNRLRRKRRCGGLSSGVIGWSFDRRLYKFGGGVNLYWVLGGGAFVLSGASQHFGGLCCAGEESGTRLCCRLHFTSRRRLSTAALKSGVDATALHILQGVGGGSRVAEGCVLHNDAV